MDFTITEDQATLTDGVRDYLAGVHAPEVLRALDASDSRRSAGIWQGLTEMGLPGLLVPEAQGGLGLSLLEAVLIAAERRRAAARQGGRTGGAAYRHRQRRSQGRASA